MAIETSCVVRCDGCGSSRTGVLRHIPIPAYGGSMEGLFRLAAIGTAGAFVGWHMEGDGKITCDACFRPSEAPYR